MPVYNCTSWADSVFDDIIECENSINPQHQTDVLNQKHIHLKVVMSMENYYLNIKEHLLVRSKKMSKLMNKLRKITKKISFIYKDTWKIFL